MPFQHLSNCAACGARNRIPSARLADTGRCGKCKATLAPANSPIEVNAEAFDEIIRTAKVPVMVDFWAEWCGPCRMVAPEVHAVAQALAGRALVLKVDTEAEQGLAARFQIRSIPTLMVFRDGRPVAQRAGAAKRQELQRWLESASAAASS